MQSGNRLALFSLFMPLYSNQANEESQKEKARTIPLATLGVGVSSTFEKKNEKPYDSIFFLLSLSLCFFRFTSPAISTEEKKNVFLCIEHCQTLIKSNLLAMISPIKKRMSFRRFKSKTNQIKTRMKSYLFEPFSSHQ